MRDAGAAVALVCAVACAVALVAPAQAWARSSEPQVSEAQAYEIQDQNGTVLAAKNADQEMAMASITKVMTAMVALDSGKSLDDVVTIDRDLSYEANAQLIGLKTGDVLTFRELMLAMLVYSGNDAASYVAIASAGSEEAFVAKMNQKAAELGMTHTHFKNPHGLEDDGHYSSAHDLVVMGRQALREYPFIAQAVVTPSITIPVGGTQRTFNSTDDLMGSYGGLCGIKTGSVSTGTTFLGSSKQYGLQTFSCVLGCETTSGRFDDTATLMDWAYDECFDHVEFGRRTVPVRVSTYDLGFWGKVLTYPDWDVTGRSYSGRPINYKRSMQRASMLEPNTAVGSGTWTQDGRPVACAVYSTGNVVVGVPDINLFALPLFVNVRELAAA